jgi:GTP-binding protein
MNNEPIVTIIGRPNVGKSSLFNRLLGHRKAIVSSESGTTRDRSYSKLNLGDLTVRLVDTAGLSGDLDENIFGREMLEQIQVAVAEADLLIFMLDAKAGLTHEDRYLADIIRKADTPAIVFINKVDNDEQFIDPAMLNLGIGETLQGSLTQRRGHLQLLDEMKVRLSAGEEPTESTHAIKLPRIAIAGRPNVGKSSLYNAIIGDSRTIVSDIAGTTRDAIDSEVTWSDGFTCIFTDTAGLRRRSKIGQTDKIERYSVMRTKQSIDRSDLVLLVVDAEEGLTRGDAHVADYALQNKKRLITVINKSDLTHPDEFNFRKFPFLTRHPMIFVSATKKFFIEELLTLVREQLNNEDGEQSQNSSPEIVQ